MNVAKTTALPRRYEDTRPALNQAFTHGSILEIGRKLSEESEGRRREEQEWEARRREEEAWRRAEEHTEQCVRSALKEEREKEDKARRRIQEEHEEEVRREVGRREELLVQRSVERSYEERMRGERKLNDVVAKLYDNFAAEKKAAVESARRDEQDIAEDKLQRAGEESREKLREQIERDAAQTEDKLEELRSKMEEQCRVSVEEAVSREKESGNAEIARISSEFEDKVSDLKQTLGRRNERIGSLESELAAMRDLKDCYITKLRETREAFVNFAEKCRPDFDVGQSDYLVPLNVLEARDLPTHDHE